MSYLTLAAQGASTALGIVGALATGQSAAYNAAAKAESDARVYSAHADADAFNAKVARQLAGSERQRSFADAFDYRRVQTAKFEYRRAVQSGGGLDMLEGSPLLVNDKIFEAVDFGAQRIAAQGQIAYTRYTNQAELLDVSSVNFRTSADAAREAGKASVRNINFATGISAASAGAKGSYDMYNTLVGSKGSAWDNYVNKPTPRVSGTSYTKTNSVNPNDLEW